MSSTCLVVLTDSLYLQGTRKLLESWAHYNASLPLVVLSDEPCALDAPFIRTRASQRILLDKDKYQAISPYKNRRSQRHARTFYKFEAFADYGYEQNLFLDSDILCLAPCPELYSPTSNRIRAAKDTGFRPRRGYQGSDHEINSGVMLINRAFLGPRSLEQLHQIARNSPGRGGYDSGDQGIINKWIRKNSIPLELLPQSYNLIKKDYSDTSQIEDCRLIHFCNRKPWFPTPRPEDAGAPLVELWHRS